MIPIFTSHFSLGKSTLTLEKPEEIDNNKPISIFSIARTNNLKEIFLVEDNFSGFIEAYKNSQNCEVNLRFGLKLVMSSNIEDKSEESLRTESKVIIWMKNSEGYKDLIKIYSKSATDGYYYNPRFDWNLLKTMWSDNLCLSIPSYSSFLHNNLLKGNYSIPDFGQIKPNIFFSNMNLPFDYLIEENHKKYSIENGLELLECHPIYFYSSRQFDSYLCFKAIHKRSVMSKPNLDHHASREFCWQSYLKK